MKLVEIKDVRVGQVWQDIDGNYEVICGDEYFAYYFDESGLGWGCYNFDQYCVHKKLIGKIGITHKIEDNKLIEIPREDFQVDDVVVDTEEGALSEPFVLTSFNSSKQYSSGIGATIFHFPLTRHLKKLGIYRATHEFVNNRECKMKKINIIKKGKLIEYSIGDHFGEQALPQAMFYHEREWLKDLATNLSKEGKCDELCGLIIVIAHWLRQREPITFKEYYEFSLKNKNRSDFPFDEEITIRGVQDE